ncbi:MAG TPA: VWA domain-containing protein [Terracidiphilus sp.]|jgi:VWFA-related protein|nr:VWA domain-containing protein [Terracidiphilus sp.]
MTKPTLLSLSALAVTAVLLCPGTRAQQPSEVPAATLKMTVREVVLPVTVRDKKGELVTTLQKSDFTLDEDGRPQTIKSFTHDTSQPYRVGLLVDTSRSLSGAMEAERKAAATFVDDLLPAPPAESKDQAFLIHFDREVELLQDFTNSRDKLHHELEDMGPTAQQHDDRQGPETTDNPNTTSPRRRGGTQLYDAIYLAADELMKQKDGRKALVIFSDGADRGSKETLNDAIDAADRANLTIYTIFFKGEREQQDFGSHGGGRRGGGGGWPGGGGGGGWPGSGGGRRQPEPTSATGIDGKKIMQEIASRSGGHAFEAKKPQDLDAIYKLIDQEMRSQYLLTYTPDKVDTDGGFHKIALTTNNKDWSVATREGYYAPEGKQ